MRTLPVVLSVILLWSAGCAPADRGELTKEILKTDPEFKTVMEKHRLLLGQIETEERKLALKRSTVEQAITQMRKDLAAETATVRNKTTELKKRMDPERERLTLDLSMASEELRAKRIQRASLGRQIAQLRKAAQSSSSTWTAEERSRQEAQVNEMLRDAKRLDQEMATLKEHVRLIKIKLLLIGL